ncbi:hypothetical protein EPYR_02137 [Erwinia pyrifoliae DSM 12163]|nr:hypothetical protein EPYR_02137 [Erwinia pyrifoliae DSM 12163]
MNLSLFQGYFHSKAFDSVITFKKLARYWFLNGIKLTVIIYL